MKALLLKEYMKLELAEMPEPEFGPHDVLVRVKACGICGSDVHGLDGSTGRRLPPIVMGHEAAGTVAWVGGEVEGFREGGHSPPEFTSDGNGPAANQVWVTRKSCAGASICDKVGSLYDVQIVRKDRCT